MQLIDLRNEVLNHGFDPVFFGITRVNQYLNDALQFLCSRVDFYQEEAVQDTTTSVGMSLIAFPADFARIRSLRDTNLERELVGVDLRMIDRSAAASGHPNYYAIDGANVHLFPTPDAAYPLELRYWKLPATLVADADVPAIPAKWHRLLWYWAVKECYLAEDDDQKGATWKQTFDEGLAEFSADVKFPSTDRPVQVSGMWDGEQSLGSANSWILGG